MSRVTCFGHLRHQEVGFTGPLNRNLLGYHAMISTARNSLRDLIEVCLTTLLLNGDADRDRNDFIELGFRLVSCRQLWILCADGEKTTITSIE